MPIFGNNVAFPSIGNLVATSWQPRGDGDVKYAGKIAASWAMVLPLLV
jgi:hypothetical protein